MTFSIDNPEGGCNNPPLGKYVWEKPSGEQGFKVACFVYYVKIINTFLKKKTICMILTGGNWQKWKRVFLTCPCHEIYRDEAVGLKSCKNTWKITIFVKMWNLGRYRENLIFCQ